MRKTKEEIKRQRHDWVTGKVGQAVKEHSTATQFEQLLTRLGLAESTCHLNETCAAWCRSNRNFRFIPELVLHRLKTKTLYEEHLSPYSLVAGTVIPEPMPTVDNTVRI